MASYQSLDEGIEWSLIPRFDHIDWNDIVEAELSGDSEALSLLQLVSIFI